LHAVFVSAVPPNQIGDRCIGELRRHGVDTSYVHRGGNRLGIYFLESGAVQRPSSIIYDRSGSALSETGRGDIPWNEVFSNARWFHLSGITPALTASTAEVCMEAVDRAKTAGVTVSCDLNYRKKLWKYGKQPHEVMEKIVRYADIVVGNEEDYQRSLSLKAEIDVDAGSLDPALYARMTEQVLETYPNLRAAAVTLRTSYSASHNRWQAVLRSRDRFHTSRSYEVRPIVDRVGSGDAFAAGLIYGLSCGMDDAEGLEFATAAGCLKHSIPGDFLILTRDEVSALMADGGSGRIQR
jgi:2-dehydro-3-deoxygluconokinase